MNAAFGFSGAYEIVCIKDTGRIFFTTTKRVGPLLYTSHSGGRPASEYWHSLVVFGYFLTAKSTGEVNFLRSVMIFSPQTSLWEVRPEASG